MNIRKLNEELEKVLNEDEESDKREKIMSQILQLFPWSVKRYSYTFIHPNYDADFDFVGSIEIRDEEWEIFLIMIYSDHITVYHYNNGPKKHPEELASIKIDNITPDEIVSSRALDLAQLAKPYIDKKYEEIQQKKQNNDVESDDYEDGEYEQELYDFISTLPEALKRKLGKKFEANQTDNTIYINYGKKPDHTVFVEPLEDSTQSLKIGLLDDTNDEIDYQELDLEDFGKSDITNIADAVKELFDTVE